MLQSIRDWLRSDMLVLRWVFLALYVLLLLSLSVPLWVDGDAIVMWLILAGVLFGAQALFIFGAGTINLCFPLKRSRLWMPVVVAGFMMTVLVFGLILAMMELFQLDDAMPEALLGLIVWGSIPVSWLFWGFVLWHYARDRQRLSVLGRFSALLFVGSLAELLACVPSHIITSRRPQCLAGLMTMLGIVAGLYVMLFAFGPAIVVLFLRPRYRREVMEAGPMCMKCGYNLTGTLAAGRDACPECGEPVSERQRLAPKPHLGA